MAPDTGAMTSVGGYLWAISGASRLLQRIDIAAGWDTGALRLGGHPTDLTALRDRLYVTLRDGTKLDLTPRH